VGFGDQGDRLVDRGGAEPGIGDREDGLAAHGPMDLMYVAAGVDEALDLVSRLLSATGAATG
jgi:hypothetical protein